jgi:hypothetical protein
MAATRSKPPEEMNTPPKRTGASPLSDDELLLFDVMFDGNAPMGMMRRTGYRVHMNVRYAHTLSDADLVHVLDSLIQRGLVRRHCERDGMYYGLTRAGGERWESERRPDWSLHLRDVYGQMRSGMKTLVVCSPSCETAERFLETARRVGWRDFSRARTRHWSFPNYSLIPWKRFPRTHLLAVRDVLDHSVLIDWNAYEVERTWWRDISELDTLDWERIRKLPSAP